MIWCVYDFVSFQAKKLAAYLIYKYAYENLIFGTSYKQPVLPPYNIQVLMTEKFIASASLCSTVL